jgi:hypothetical protein
MGGMSGPRTILDRKLKKKIAARNSGMLSSFRKENPL